MGRATNGNVWRRSRPPASPKHLMRQHCNDTVLFVDFFAIRFTFSPTTSCSEDGALGANGYKVQRVESKRVDKFAEMSDEELEAYVNGDRGLEH